jgi:tyrosyl-tRNA synthetase
MTQHTYKSDFLQTLSARGFIHQCTDASTLDALFANERVAAYIGFDCTAPSLHVGSLIQIMILRWLQKTGHRPVVLIGGGTTRVGDPSGKDESRKLLDSDDIDKNARAIISNLEPFIQFGSGNRDALMVNNAEWLLKLNYIDFLRDVARHFSVNRMLTQDSVKLRLEREQNLSLLEFNYMVLQAYDFVELNKRYGCRVQIGGSDQWGNIIMGIDLERRMRSEQKFSPLSLDSLTKGKGQVLEVQPMIKAKQSDARAYSEKHFMSHMGGGDTSGLFGLTTPLLATASGQKMGKTASGAVWLHKDMLPVYDYWQFWRNTEDADVGRFLRLFTEIPLDEIARLEALQGAEINEAKKILATAATALCHGERAAKLAAETATKTFEQGEAAENLPTFELHKAELGKGIAAYDLFRQAGLAPSGGEAKRLVRGGGAKVNDQKVADENQLITPGDFSDGTLKLTAGKKRHMLVKLV